MLIRTYHLQRRFGCTVDRTSLLAGVYPKGYNRSVYQLRQTEIFAKWLNGLRDVGSKARILARLESARLGNLGDSKTVGGGIREMRIHTGPGYRVYFVRRQRVVLILLCGGDKSSQSRDVRRAQQLMRDLEEEWL